MSLLNKVKNFFYEEVEVDEEEEARKEEEKRRIKEQKREEKRQASLEKIEKMKAERALKEEKKRLEEQQAIQIEKPKPIKNEEISERELFKSERTFNFPMDLGDDIFDEEPKKVEEVKPKVEERKTTYVSPTTVRRYENISREPVKETPKEDLHKFRPSPVISPVYGILDKNYTVDDVKEKSLSKTKEFSIEKKIVDFDSVRNRAYKDLDDEIEKTLTDSKDIFYNLDSEEPIVENNISDYEEEPHDAEENNDVVITYEVDDVETPVLEEKKSVDVDIPEEESEDEEDFEIPTPDIEIPKRSTKTTKRTRRSKKVEEEPEETNDDTKEDLFNLIDNMYSDDEEEEED